MLFRHICDRLTPAIRMGPLSPHYEIPERQMHGRSHEGTAKRGQKEDFQVARNYQQKISPIVALHNYCIRGTHN